MTSLEQFVKTVRIFENLTEEALAYLVPLFEIRNVKSKECVIREGEDCQLLLLRREPFQQYLLSYPIAANRILFQMLKDLFFRLDETSQELLLSAGTQTPNEAALHRLLR